MRSEEHGLDRSGCRTGQFPIALVEIGNCFFNFFHTLALKDLVEGSESWQASRLSDDDTDIESSALLSFIANPCSIESSQPQLPHGCPAMLPVLFRWAVLGESGSVAPCCTVAPQWGCRGGGSPDFELEDLVTASLCVTMRHYASLVPRDCVTGIRC